MNKRKAGEDFYFLQKIAALGPLGEINSATVYPSPRASDRVPFGTGKAINDLLVSGQDSQLTYHPEIFKELKALMVIVPSLYESTSIKTVIETLPQSVREYLNQIDFTTQLEKLKRNSSSKQQFLKGFFQWFNGFLALKYIHFARDKFYTNIPVLEAAQWIIHEVVKGDKSSSSPQEALEALRQYDRLNKRE